MKKVLVLSVALVLCLAMVASADVTVLDNITANGLGSTGGPMNIYGQAKAISITPTQNETLTSMTVGLMADPGADFGDEPENLRIFLVATDVNGIPVQGGHYPLVGQMARVNFSVDSIPSTPTLYTIDMTVAGGGLVSGSLDLTAGTTYALWFAENDDNPCADLVYSGVSAAATSTSLMTEQHWFQYNGAGAGQSSMVYTLSGTDNTGQNPCIILTATPEPVTLALLAIGGLGMLARRNRKA